MRWEIKWDHTNIRFILPVAGNTIDLEYNPEEDIITIYVKDQPIQAKFKDDIVSIFEKYSPFNMELSFDNDLVPTLSRKEKVSPDDFSTFFD